MPAIQTAKLFRRFLASTVQLHSAFYIYTLFFLLFSQILLFFCCQEVEIFCRIIIDKLANTLGVWQKMNGDFYKFKSVTIARILLLKNILEGNDTSREENKHWLINRGINCSRNWICCCSLKRAFTLKTAVYKNWPRYSFSNRSSFSLMVVVARKIRLWSQFPSSSALKLQGLCCPRE